jgi:hypothetical protein
MKKKNFNLIKEKIRKKNFMINELKIIILKSILQNKKNNLKLRSLTYYLLCTLKYHAKISYQKNVCFDTGKFKSTINNFSLSKQRTKYYLNNLKMTGIKKLS